MANNDKNELGGRAARHMKTQNDEQVGPGFRRNIAKFATGNGQSGGKPRGHLKSEARRDGGTHKR